jgi:phosphate transport system substrate-binding protein
MSKRILFYLFLINVGVFLSSCDFLKGKLSEGDENYTYGEAFVLADESIFPVVDDEHQVFLETYKRAKINMLYKPLKQVIQLFVEDSVSVAILPRLLKPEEKAYFDQRKITIRATKFAIDGIGLITGKNNPDSLITQEELIHLLSGKSNNKRVLVFDNPQSSIVEYLMELANVKELPKDLAYSLQSSQEVISYVKDNPNSIGIISVSWIKRAPADMQDDIKQVKFVAVKSGNGNYELPSQSNLKTKTYPLTRDLYLIDGQGKAGLGTGFAAFMASDIGQRIILKSGLAPDSLPSRQIIIRK